MAGHRNGGGGGGGGFGGGGGGVLGGAIAGEFAGGEAADQADEEVDDAVDAAPVVAGLGDEEGVFAKFAHDGEAEAGEDDGDKAREFEGRVAGGEAKLGVWGGRGRHDQIPTTACEPLQGIFSGWCGEVVDCGWALRNASRGVMQNNYYVM